MKSSYVPIAEVISGILNRFSGLVSRVNLRVYHVRFGQGYGQEVMNMRGKAPEAGLVAHEAMDIDEKQCPSAISA